MNARLARRGGLSCLFLCLILLVSVRAHAALSVSASPPTGKVGSAYSATVTASGGIAPYSFSVSSGSLPTGLTLAGVGALSGVPKAAGTFKFTLTVTDSQGAAANRECAVTIEPKVATITIPALTLTPNVLPVSNVGANAAFSQTFSATGGVPPYTFSLSSGSVPPGLTVTGVGVLSGTPTTQGAFHFVLTVTDTRGFSGTRAYSLVIGVPTLTFTPGALLVAAMPAHIAYAQTFGATGGYPPYTFSVRSGTLPAGMTFSGAGLLSGAPSTPGTYDFTLVVTDSAGGSSAHPPSIPHFVCPAAQPSAPPVHVGRKTAAPAQQPNVSAPPHDVAGVKQQTIEAPAEPQL